MWMSKTITTRIMVCLAALTVPLQGLPAASCHCCPGQSQTDTECCSEQGSSTDSQTTRCRCTGAAVCHCSDDAELPSISAPTLESRPSDITCSSEIQAVESGTCSCGTDCHCGSHHQPVSPLAPAPVENNPAEKLVDFPEVVFVVTIDNLSQTAGKTHFNAAPQAALDRCVSLCRFTL